MIIYGFILSGNVFEPPNGDHNEFPLNFTLPVPVDETNDYSQCGYLSEERQSKFKIYLHKFERIYNFPLDLTGYAPEAEITWWYFSCLIGFGQGSKWSKYSNLNRAIRYRVRFEIGPANSAQFVAYY